MGQAEGKSGGTAESHQSATPQSTADDVEYLSNSAMLIRKNIMIPQFRAAKGDLEKKKELFSRYVAETDADGADLELKGDFAQGLAWINCAPLSFNQHLQGKIVLLDFWTYCCINCMHVIPDLEFLEHKYSKDPVVVIGVHSAKFSNEKDSANIRNACLRYGIVHPVVNDTTQNIYHAVGASAWPTFAILGPRANLLYLTFGEGKREEMELLCDAALAYYGEKKQLDRKSKIPWAPISAGHPKSSGLSFPGKVALSTLSTPIAKKLIAISDSNNFRIIVASYEVIRTKSGALEVISTVERVFGSGVRGRTDGRYSKCSFNRPQGLCFDPSTNEVLYVADTENHCIRKIDLKKKRVSTILGTGAQGLDYKGGKTGQNQPISSPWDIVVEGKDMYIAMAGTHQIWKYDIDSGVGVAFSGTGRESKLDASGDLTTANFAQPSGLSWGNDASSVLLLADAESSSIRTLDFVASAVTTRVGGAKDADDLMAFGDKPGVGLEARLQHPLAVAFIDRKTLRPLPKSSTLAKNGGVDAIVCDSYNHKLKLLNLSQNSVVDWLGTSKPGYVDSEVQSTGKTTPQSGIAFSEPSGLSLDAIEGLLFVADTNNGVIRIVDLETDQVSTLSLDLPKPSGAAASPAEAKNEEEQSAPVVAERLVAPKRAKQVNLGTVEVADLTKVALRFQILLGETHHFTTEAVSSVQVLLSGRATTVSHGLGRPVEIQTQDPSLHETVVDMGVLNLKAHFSDQETDAVELEVEASVFECSEADNLCLPLPVLASLRVHHSSSNVTGYHQIKLDLAEFNKATVGAPSSLTSRKSSRLGVIGDGETLGSWHPSKVVRMTVIQVSPDGIETPVRPTTGTSEPPIPPPPPSESTPYQLWEVRIPVLTGMPVSYKYIIIDEEDRSILWESKKPEVRSILPLGFEMIVNDGQFASVWYDEGWLASETSVRLQAARTSTHPKSTSPVITTTQQAISSSIIPPISTLASDTSLILERKCELVFHNEFHRYSIELGAVIPKESSTSAPSLVFLPAFPLPAPRQGSTSPPSQDQEALFQELVFYAGSIRSISINVELVHYAPTPTGVVATRMAFGLIPGDTFTPTNWWTSSDDDTRPKTNGVLRIPLFQSENREKFFGELAMRFLVVVPFVHPLNNLRSLWLGYNSKPIGMQIGHRGCGSSVLATISENTILSFLTAAQYGADYVEFDIQLTRDSVPVIHHDYVVPIKVSGDDLSNDQDLQIPVCQITKKQFKRLRRESSPQAFNALIEKAAHKSTTPFRKSRSLSELPHLNPEAATSGSDPVLINDSVSRTKPPTVVNPRDAFATLRESLRVVPPEVGFAIELKIPPEWFEKKFSFRYHDRNHVVDCVLKVLFGQLQQKHPRSIVFFSFDPDVCLLLSQKQPRFPVMLVVCWNAKPDDPDVDPSDPRMTSIQTSISFAKAARLRGIVGDAKSVLMDHSIVKQVHSAGLLLFTYGEVNSDSEARHKQKSWGVDSVIVDNILKIGRGTLQAPRTVQEELYWREPC